MLDFAPEEPEEVEETHAPIILVREAPHAPAAVCDVLNRFQQALRLVERLTTRPPNDRFDEIVHCCVTPDTFAMLAEADRILAESRSGPDESSAFLRVALNMVLFGEGKTFGITVGDETVEAELTKAGYDVRPFVLEPAGINSPRWDADRLAEFVFGLLVADD
jgi:hypothetical protein